MQPQAAGLARQILCNVSPLAPTCLASATRWWQQDGWPSPRCLSGWEMGGTGDFASSLYTVQAHQRRWDVLLWMGASATGREQMRPKIGSGYANSLKEERPSKPRSTRGRPANRVVGWGYRWRLLWLRWLHTGSHRSHSAKTANSPTLPLTTTSPHCCCPQLIAIDCTGEPYSHTITQSPIR